MILTDLPTEILLALPRFLHNLEDYANTASTCRRLRAIFADSLPHDVLQLAARSAPTFFSPHPWFLVLATSRGVGTWAAGNPSRTARLKEAFRGGIDGLYALCLEVGGLTMADVRRLHRARFDVINPLATKLDQMAGKAYYDVPDFWEGGVSQPATVHCEPDRAAFQIMVYWELFGPTLASYWEPARGLPRLGLDLRLEFIKFCIPDWACPRGTPRNEFEADQVALQHIFVCGRWKRLWEKAMSEAGPPFDDDWRQALWKNAFTSFGLESMEIIKDVKVTSTIDKRFSIADTVQPTPVLTPAWLERLTQIRAQIEALDAEHHKPRTSTMGPRARPFVMSEAPDMPHEINVSMAGLWVLQAFSE